MDEDKIILDLCGGTGAWSKPYADAGYDVRVVTLPDADVRVYQPPNMGYLQRRYAQCFHLQERRQNSERF